MAEEETLEDQGLQLSYEKQRDIYRRVIQQYPYLVGVFASWTQNEDQSEEVQLANLTKPGPVKKKWDALIARTAPFRIKRAYGPTDQPTYIGGDTVTFILEPNITIADFWQVLADQRGLRRHSFIDGEHVIEVGATEEERKEHEASRLQPWNEQQREAFINLCQETSPELIRRFFQKPLVAENEPDEEKPQSTLPEEAEGSLLQEFFEMCQRVTYDPDTEPVVSSADPNAWWRNYEFTAEQRARHEAEWERYGKDHVLSTMKRMMNGEGGGFAGPLGVSWCSPRGDPRPWPLNIIFWVPPFEKGYFTEAGKARLLKQLESVTAQIRKQIEQS